VLAQFCYVGAQVGTWSFFIQYIQDYTGEHEKLAGTLLTGTLVAFAVGRFSATWLMKFIKPAKLMGILRNRQHHTGPASRGYSRLDWCMVDFPDQFLHVADVSHDFCPGHQRSGGEYQIGRITDGDVHYWRRGIHAGYGCHFGPHGQYGTGHDIAADMLSGCNMVRGLGIEGSRE